MLVHTVFFWLRPDLSPAQREEFRKEGLDALRTIGSVSAMYVGTPAPVSARPVVDASYSFTLTALFADVAAHDAYQVDPVHKVFIERFKPYWERVQIYDAM